jgi:hypothetical protein
VCPLCNNPVRDAKTAILHRATGSPAHFDCILRELTQGESLEKGEKITYLGKGTFGVLSYRNASSQLPYLIRKRIHYEDQEKRASWRAPVRGGS